MGSATCGLFDTIPRELRDRIYTEAVQLLVVADGAWKWATNPECEEPELARLALIDMTLEMAMLMPGKPLSNFEVIPGKFSSSNGRQSPVPGSTFYHRRNPKRSFSQRRSLWGEAIHNNMGVLLANRQMHMEASEVLYSRNTLVSS